VVHDGITASAVWWEEAFMAGQIYRFLAGDHARLDGLFERATTEAGAIDRTAYAAFRAGLLKHIGMEEKILLPAAQRVRGGEPLGLAAKVRLDHGALAALLAPTPTPAIVAALRTILGAHNALEEGSGGLYECCERLVGAEAEALLARLHAAPEVPAAPHADGPHVMDVVRRALVRAGYDAALLTETP
jgi:hemerythrin HHE cation binding domain-containing protein